MELKERIILTQDSVIDHRQWLHAHPELSGQEKETAAYIAGTGRTDTPAVRAKRCHLKDVKN